MCGEEKAYFLFVWPATRKLFSPLESAKRSVDEFYIYFIL